ncbi:MAG: LarC family nickel insertion protein [Myxococcota bacterium]
MSAVEPRVLYLDLVGGVAGDMLLAALIDLGASLDAVRAALVAVGLDDVEIVEREVHPCGLRARQLDVLVGGALADSTTVEGTPSVRTTDESWRQSRPHDPSSGMGEPPHPQAPGDGHDPAHGHDHTHAHGPAHGHHHAHDHDLAHGHHHAHGRGHRPWRVIRERLEAAPLDPRVRSLAQDAFRRLASAEASAHGLDMEEVEFHEVGSDDAIADILGIAVAFVELGFERVVASPFPLGRGLSRGSHGPLPIPGPATLHLLEGAPTVETSLLSETVTPTGAALVRTLADGFGPIPSLRLERVGVGAGHKSWPDRPNVVRALAGRAEAALPEPDVDAVVVETNLDDMSPEHLGPLYDALFAAGALDVWATPAVFKKGRGGWTVSALVPGAEEGSVSRALFRHSPTLGVRIRPVARRRLERSIETVETPFGKIRLKRSVRPDAPDYFKPEHDDVRAAAERAGVPLRVVEQAALRAAWDRSG